LPPWRGRDDLLTENDGRVDVRWQPSESGKASVLRLPFVEPNGNQAVYVGRIGSKHFDQPLEPFG
jgi:hypothetical protein